MLTRTPSVVQAASTLLQMKKTPRSKLIEKTKWDKYEYLDLANVIKIYPVEKGNQRQNLFKQIKGKGAYDRITEEANKAIIERNSHSRILTQTQIENMVYSARGKNRNKIIKYEEIIKKGGKETIQNVVEAREKIKAHIVTTLEKKAEETTDPTKKRPREVAGYSEEPLEESQSKRNKKLIKYASTVGLHNKRTLRSGHTL